MSALLADLHPKGLLGQTLVPGTEFGRTRASTKTKGGTTTKKQSQASWLGRRSKGAGGWGDGWVEGTLTWWRRTCGSSKSPSGAGTPTATTSCQASVLEQAMSELLADLQAKGLLGQTLVVVGAEFG